MQSLFSLLLELHERNSISLEASMFFKVRQLDNGEMLLDGLEKPGIGLSSLLVAHEDLGVLVGQIDKCFLQQRERRLEVYTVGG